MADNVAITPGSGASVSTEEVTTLNGGTVPAQHVQRIGNAFVTGDGTAVDAATGAGAVGSNVQRVTLASDGPGVALLTTIAGAVTDTTTDSPVAPHQPCDVITVAPTLDTVAYAVGDILFGATAIPNAVRANDKHAILQSLALIDKSNQKPGMKLKFWSANVVYGTINTAPSISDSDTANFLGAVDIAAADWDSDSAAATANYKNIGLLLEPLASTSTVYFTARLTAGTPTFALGDLLLRFGLVWE